MHPCSLVKRDVDVLAELAQYNAAAVFLSLTTLNNELRQKMEPRASHPQARLEAVRVLAAAGIPTGVMTAPIIPGLNDHEITALLEAAAAAGATTASFTILRLSHGLRDLFSMWLDQHFPTHKEKVLNRIRDMRGGKLNETKFGERMRGHGIVAETIAQIHAHVCGKLGLNTKELNFSTSSFRRSKWEQATLFD